MPALLTPQRRKATGAYYTPPALIDLLLDHLATPPQDILDPACGPGDFLVAAQRRFPDARLLGVDIDPAAVECCRSVLNGDPSPVHQIANADALLAPPAFLRRQSFDLILGNPPFVNAIEGLLSPARKARLRAAFPAVRGAADLAHYFLAQAISLVRPGGRVALVLPRAILNSPAAAALRGALPDHLRPNLIYAPERPDFFPGASVFVCCLILGPDPLCRFSSDPDPAAARFTLAPVRGENWWCALREALDEPAASTIDLRSDALGARFQVAASMTAADAYDLRAHLVDDAQAAGPRLATTGLIEPRACVWGQRPCRYLKRTYAHPRVRTAELPRALAARVAAATRRPKIVVAGLARQIEAFLDPAGEHVGAVSTFTIFHWQDDASALAGLLEHLHAPDVTRSLIRQLGANGLRGQHITLSKAFLRDLHVPSA